MSSQEIFALWLPLAIAAILAIVGLVRGAVRESLVSMSILLGAFIVSQWAAPWAEGLHSVVPAYPVGDEQFAISVAVLWLIVLVIGYGVGVYIPRERLTGISRLAGGLLGFANGAAAAGWSLRYAITAPGGGLTEGPLLNDPAARAFMIWAGWFPVALAFIGALLVLLRPVRRAQSAVSRPSNDSDWSPQAYGTQGAQTVGAGSAYNTSTPQTPPSQPAAAERSAWQPPESAQRTTAFDTQPEPPTSRLPADDVPTLPVQAVRTGAETAGPVAASTGEEKANSQNAAQTGTSWLEDADSPTRDRAAGAVPAWMLGSTNTSNTADSTRPYDTLASSRLENAGSAARIGTGGAARANCANCGAPLTPGASFCTECGTRVTQT